MASTAPNNLPDLNAEMTEIQSNQEIPKVAQAINAIAGNTNAGPKQLLAALHASQERLVTLDESLGQLEDSIIEDLEGMANDLFDIGQINEDERDAMIEEGVKDYTAAAREDRDTLLDAIRKLQDEAMNRAPNNGETTDERKKNMKAKMEARYNDNGVIYAGLEAVMAGTKTIDALATDAVATKTAKQKIKGGTLKLQEKTEKTYLEGLIAHINERQAKFDRNAIEGLYGKQASKLEIDKIRSLNANKAKVVDYLRTLIDDDSRVTIWFEGSATPCEFYGNGSTIPADVITRIMKEGDDEDIVRSVHVRSKDSMLTTFDRLSQGENIAGTLVESNGTETPVVINGLPSRKVAVSINGGSAVTYETKEGAAAGGGEKDAAALIKDVLSKLRYNFKPTLAQ